MNSEERIIQFIEHELTPEEERGVLDECAGSDEMRGLLKQHVSLSRNMAAALSAIAVPATAEERLSQNIAGMRPGAAPAVPKVFPRGVMLSAISGLAIVAVSTVAYLTMRISTVAPTVISAPPVPQTVSAPPAPVPVPSVAHEQRIHRRSAQHAEVTTVPAPQSAVDAKPSESKAKHKRAIRLRETDKVD